jgi:archaellum component FlaF (FlaF/FlaG flagellin family)
MKKGVNPLLPALFISFLLGIAGLYLMADSYYTGLALAASENQLEFLKTVPSIVSKTHDPVKLPAYQENIILSSNPVLKGFLYGDYFGGRMSIRQAAIKVTAYPFSTVEIAALVDTRERK